MERFIVRSTFSKTSRFLCGSVLLLGVILVTPASSQQISYEKKTAERNRLYDELDQEVTALQRVVSVLKKAVKLSKPSVVHIEARKTTGSRGLGTVEEAGSGIIIQFKGKFYILTNRHVIHNAAPENIKIRLASGRILRPIKVWSDDKSDVAVIAVSASDLLPARIGDSSTTEIGDFVLAVGSPFGLSHSVTYGIISAKGRHDLKLGQGDIPLQDFIQTDAAINPGNSGGPLLNLRGEVIGINTAIASSSGGNEGIGFSIPINLATMFAQQLIEHGVILKAYLGVTLTPLNKSQAKQLGLPRASGALVSSVTPKSPAADAGIKASDVVLWFDGTEIENHDHLINQVAMRPIGKEVEVIILRNRKQLTTIIKLENRKKFDNQ